MSALREIHVPDIGDFTEVEIIEVSVAPGDQVNEEDPLITLGGPTRLRWKCHRRPPVRWSS